MESQKGYSHRKDYQGEKSGREGKQEETSYGELKRRISPESDVTPVRPKIDKTRGGRRKTNDALVEANMPRRPGRSDKYRSYQRQQFLVNHFPFKIRDRILYQYHIDFEPVVENFKRRIILVKEYAKKRNIAEKDYVFDGSQIWFKDKYDDHEVMIQQDTGEVTLKVRAVSVINPKDKNAPSPYQFYNILFKKVLRSLNLNQIGRNFFDPSAVKTEMERDSIHLWPGYITSITPDESGISLVANILHKVVRTTTVLDDITAEQNASRNWKESLLSRLVGSIVISNYGKMGRRTYRIDDIAWDKTPQSTFEKMNEDNQPVQISFLEYYIKAHGRKINYKDQPLLISYKISKRTGAKETLYLIPELMNPTGLKDSMKSDFNLMRRMSDITKPPPQIKTKECVDLISRIEKAPKAAEILRNWDIALSKELQTVDGVVYPLQEVIFNGKDRPEILKDLKNHWDKDIKGVWKVKAPFDWAIVCLDRALHDVEAFTYEMNQRLNKTNIKFKPPKIIRLRELRDFNQEIESLVRKDKMEFIVIVLPKKDTGIYSGLKRLCSVTLGVPSQVLVQRDLNKKLNKVIYQMNCKRGGTLWKLNLSVNTTNDPANAYAVVGIDVTHGGKSVVGFCGTTDDTLCQYYSKVAIQPKNQEIVSSLERFFKDYFDYFKGATKFLPGNLVVYRDGVGDGQLESVLTNEVQKIRLAIDETKQKYPELNWNPTLTYIVVKKRINTRIFTTRVENPPPGTCVDTGCVNRNWFDFYMVTATTLGRGTVTPVHYVVVYNSSSMTSDQVQLLTWQLCHLYFNHGSTIRVPAPVHYAHRLAFLCGTNLSGEPHRYLESKLHFL